MEVVIEIHNIIKGSVSGGFWHFMGYWLLIGAMVSLPAVFIKGIIRAFAKSAKEVINKNSLNEKIVDKTP